MPAAPAWGMALGPIGKGLIFASIAFFLISIIGWAVKRNGIGKVGFWLGSLSLFGAFGCLAALFLGNQYQYDYVFSHSETILATKYKVAAIWSGQQGSFLLWAVCSAFFGLLVAPKTGEYRRWFTIPYAVFLGGLGAILAYETPFNLIPEIAALASPVTPPTGTGLTPALQNYWVVIHPPTIFMGFGSLTVLYCWALAAMITRSPLDWAKMVRPWAIASATILGIGLIMGGFWAYETLGWGGFWAWDPVENVSFVPWVLGICLIHGLIIQITRGRYIGANLVLAGLPFIAFVYGTFLTRSGFLGDSSVHSFAQMQRGALWVLVSVGIVAIVAFFGVYLARGRRLAAEFSTGETPKGINREGMYQSSILLMSAFAAATAIGMSMPFVSSMAMKRNIAIEPWLYHQVLSWAYIPIMLLMAAVPFISWRTMTGRELTSRILNILSFSIGMTGFSLWFIRGIGAGKTTLIAGFIEISTVAWVSFLLFLSFFVVFANIWRAIEVVKKSPMSTGGFISHFGLAIFMAGMVLSSGLETKERLNVQRSRPDSKGPYTVTLKEDPKPDELFNRDNKVLFSVDSPDGTFTARPGLYYTDSADGPKPMLWPHIQRYGSHDVYFTLGAPSMNYWDTPVMMKPGESKTEKDVTLTYHGYEVVGEPGSPGTKFVGKVTVSYEGVKLDVNPVFAIGQDPSMPVAGEFRVLMTRIDAATKGAEFQLFFAEAIYPIEIYYKPMTGLVWGGAGILTIGGFMAAFYRRPRNPKSGVPVDPEAILEPEPEPAKDNAPAPVA